MTDIKMRYLLIKNDEDYGINKIQSIDAKDYNDFLIKMVTKVYEKQSFLPEKWEKESVEEAIDDGYLGNRYNYFYLVDEGQELDIYAYRGEVSGMISLGKLADVFLNNFEALLETFQSLSNTE